MPDVDPAHGVYGISVAAERAGLGTQTLRLYERHGLLQPARTAGGTRRYSEDNLDRLRRIGELVDLGVNLAGVGLVLALEADNERLRAQVARGAGDPGNADGPPPVAGKGRRTGRS